MVLLGMLLLSAVVSVHSATPAQATTTAALRTSTGNAPSAKLAAEANRFQPVPWSPGGDKFLVLFCAFGRMSNQVACLKKSLHLAATLNRTLLIPPTAILMFHGNVQEVWPLDMVVDWHRMVECLKPSSGPNTIMTFDQYFAKYNINRIVIDRIHCAAPGPAEGSAHPKRIDAVSKSLGPLIQFPPLDQYPKWLDLSKIPDSKVSSREDIVKHLGGRPERLLCAGEMFSMLTSTRSRELYSPQPQSPSSCSNLWHPHREIGTFVDGVVSKILKTDSFAAMHLRRGDFYLESVLAKHKGQVRSSYFHYSPISEVARTVAEHMKHAKTKTLYISTDASRVEFQLFKSVLKGLSPVGRIVSLSDVRGNPGWLAKQAWAKATLDMADSSPTGIPWVLVEKGICARSSLFLGTGASSFSLDILNTRCEESQRRGLDQSSLVCATAGCKAYKC